MEFVGVLFNLECIWTASRVRLERIWFFGVLVECLGSAFRVLLECFSSNSGGWESKEVGSWKGTRP